MHLALISDTHMPKGARRLSDECVARLEAADLLGIERVGIRSPAAHEYCGQGHGGRCTGRWRA